MRSERLFGFTVIDPETEARRLASLPIKILPLEPEIIDALEDWGVQDFGALVELPTLPLIQRLGQAGINLQRLARGEISRPLIPCEPATQFQETAEFDEPLDLLGPIISRLNHLLQQLMMRLKMRALATDYLEINLELEKNQDRQLKSIWVPGTSSLFHSRALKLSFPTQDCKPLMKLVELDLTEHPPQSAVKSVSIKAIPAQIRHAQSGLFERKGPEPAKLEVTLAKLRVGVGERDRAGFHKIGFPVIRSSHYPDSFNILPSPWERSISRKERRYRTDSGLATRIFRPSLKVKVELIENVPAALILEGTRKIVMNASGPWRKTGTWWNGMEKWHRDEWDIEINAGNRSKEIYKIYRDHKSGEWFIDSIYA